MENSKKNTSEKGDFIELDNSQYKKKSNFLRNLVIFLFLISISFIAGMYGDQFFYKNGKSLNIINLEKKNDFKNKLEDSNEYLKKDEFDKKIFDIESAIESVEKKILENNEKTQNLELSLAEKFKKKHINSAKNNLTEFSPRKFYNQENLINFWILKINYENRQPFGNEIETLQKMYKENNEVLHYTNYFRELNISSLKKKDFFLREINNVLSLYSEDLDELVLRVGSESSPDKSKIFDSKENFLNYFKEIAESTFKVTKLENSNLELNYQTSRMKKSFVNELIHAKELLLNGNLKESKKIIVKSNYEDRRKLSYWTNELTKVIESDKKLKNFESLLLTLMEKNFDKNF